MMLDRSATRSGKRPPAVSASMLRTIDALIAIPGLGAAVPAGRFPVKTRLRLTLLPDYELRSEIVELTTGPVDVGALTVPADYRKVDAPGR